MSGWIRARSTMAGRALLLAMLLAVGLVSFVFARVKANSGAALIATQRSAQALTAANVARVVQAAPDPYGHRKGIRATCSSLGHGALRNPWRCSISYADGRRIRYLIHLRLSGAYTGDHEVIQYHGRTRPDTGQITGCCVSVP